MGVFARASVPAMPKILLTLSLSVIALGAVPAAQAAVVPGQTIIGPTPDINPLAGIDIDLAPNGAGAVAFVAEGGVAVARGVGGVWNEPRGLPASAGLKRALQVEVASGGRVVVAYKSGNDLVASVAPAAGLPFSEPISIQTAVQAYDFEMNDAGVGYFVTSSGGDILARRLVGTTSTAVDGGALDKVDANSAGNTDQAVGVDAAGNAVAAWDEENGANTDIYARRITGTTQGAVTEATVPSLGGAPRSTGAQNVDVESDDAGHAWVAFREQFTYANARNRALVRRLVGDAFGPPLLVDNGPTLPADMTDAEFTRLAVTPAGDRALATGFVQNNATNKPSLFGAALTPGAASPFALDAPAEPTPRTTAAIVPGASALIAYAYKPTAAASPGLRARIRDGVAAFGAQTPLSDPALGSVSSAAGPVASSDGGSTVVVGYLQGEAANQRILVATVDLPGPVVAPGTPTTPTTPSTPTVSGLKLSRTTFRKGSRLPTASAKTFRTGTTISFSLSEASKVALSFESIRTGRRVGTKCKAPTRENRRSKACKRRVKVKTAISLNGEAGANKVAFHGRLTRRTTLKPGRYRLTVRATGEAGKASKPVRKNFRLLAATKKQK
jgi:hypothetical protein